MQKSRFSLIINILFISFFFFILYHFFLRFYDDYSVVKREIQGIQSVERLSGIEIRLLALRQLLIAAGAKSTQEELKVAQNYRKELLNELNDLPDAPYRKRLNEFLEDYQDDASLDDFNKIVSDTINEIRNEGENSLLLFDPKPQSSFLISLLVNLIPEALESISKVEVLEKILLSSRESTKAVLAEQSKTVNNFFFVLSQITRTIERVQNSGSLKVYFSAALQKRLETEGHADPFISNAQTTRRHDYTAIVSQYTAQLLLSQKHIKQKLLQELNQRQKNHFWMLVASLLIFLIASVLLAGRLFLRRIQREKYQKEKALLKYKTYATEALKETLYHEMTLEGACTQTVLFFASDFHAHAAVIYLLDATNQKLILGASYGISAANLQHIIELDEGSIGKCFVTKKSQTILLPDDYTINLNIFEIKPRKLLVLPFITYEKVVAVMQLAFLEEAYVDQEHLNYLCEITAETISKLQNYEKNNKLFQLIDKNVITSSTNKKGDITYVSDSFATISGYTKQELLGKKHSMVRHPDMPSELFKEMWRTISSGNIWHGEVKNRTKNGGFYWVDVTITPDLDFYGNILGYTAIRHEITDKKKIEEISVTDALTGIYNRRYFEKIFTHKLLSAKRDKKNMVFIIIDIDHFKLYNDTYGHHEGDTALIKVAQSLNNHLKRPEDYIFRIGGEEFGLLFDTINLTDAIAFANVLREEVEQLHILHQKNSASKYVTISMGMFFYDGKKSREREEDAYKYADAALYRAKEFGRNRLEVWGEN